MVPSYPARVEDGWIMKDGQPVQIRPIRPADEPLMVAFHQSLSDESVYSRYLHFVSLSQRIDHQRLAKICNVDYVNDMALVAQAEGPGIVAVGRLAKLADGSGAEIAIVVTDSFQRRGLGTEVVRRLIEIARERSYALVVADVLSDNTPMQRIFRSLGFKIQRSADGDVIATLTLTPATPQGQLTI